MAKKEIFNQYLIEIPVLIEDDSLTSPDYFRITDLPSQLTAGKNTIKFTLNTPLFANESIIYVEILDYNEDPIYYEVNIDNESSNKPAIINIFVNQDTCPGNGQIILCSTINKTIDGDLIEADSVNIRWTAPINIDISKRNEDSIIFAQTPEASVTSNYSQVNEISYVDLNNGVEVRTKEQTQTIKLTGGTEPAAKYYNYNDTPILILNEYTYTNPVSPQRGFVTSSVNAIINISSSYINELMPTSYDDIDIQQFTSDVTSFTGSFNFIQSYASPGIGSHIAYLKDPISYTIVDSNERYYPDEAELSDIDVTYTLSPDDDNLYTFKNATQNTYNSVTVNFKNLATTTGTIAKIKAYYKSSGIGEYILFNESLISELDAEFGFNPDSLVATYTVPTTHRNEKIDFKFEFVSLSGYIAEQTTESKNTTFEGGNTYVAGDDNLITGSFFVGKETNTGVQIAGDSNGSIIRSIGYEGFAKAKAGTHPGGFVIYSGSIQPLLNSSELYYGVGIELYANTSSYFKYTTSGSGLLDVRTENFFLGSANQFISGANGNIEISSSNFHLDSDGNVNMNGNITANTGNIGGFAITNDAITGSGFYLSGSATGNDFFISSSNFNIKANGDVTASSALFSGSVSVTGDINATKGNIGGFAITEYSMTGSGFYLSGVAVNNQFFLSSSKFNVKGNGDVTGSNVLFTGGKVGGFTISDNTLSNNNNFYLSGSATGNQFFISSSKFNVKANGDVTASSALFSGSVSITGDINATTGNIGGFNITKDAITGSGFYLSGSATGNGFFISSSNFNVKASGDITGSSVLFTGGKIGSFTLTNNALSGISSGATTFLISSSVDASNLSTAFFISSSKFNVRQDGTVSGSQVLFDGGKVGGFTIDSSKISGTNIVIDSAGSIQTSDYASDLKGWKISAAGNGSAEFENAKIRGTLSTAVFEKTSVNAVGGQLYVANSTTLTGSNFAGASTNGNYTSTQTTMSVENVTGFEIGEILTAKKFSNTGFATEYLYVNSASRDGVGDTDFTGRIYVTRAYGNALTGNSSSLGESPSVGQSYSGSQVIVSTGKLGSGFIRINANPNDQATPYIDVVERTGSGIYDVALKARLGDLSGLANSSYVFGKPNPGFGLATDNVFLQGGIIANTGSIGGINMASNKLFTGTGTYSDPNTGFYLDNTGKLSLKDKLSWDGTTLDINGRIEVSNGSFVPGSSIYQHGPLTHWPRSNGTPPNNLLPNAGWNAVTDNAVEYVMGPYGTQELAITCYPNGNQAGGGFDSHIFPIDSGSAYMFVVYIKKKTSSTAGYAYLGVNGYNASSTNVGMFTNAPTPSLTTNPYFLVGIMTPAGETSADSVDRWLLHIGYVYPSGSVYDSARKSVVYDLTTGLTGSYDAINETYTWNTGTTHAVIRSYHYYNNASPTGVLKYQEISRPGVFKMDGSEPTIQSLLSNTSTGGSTKIDGASITTGKIRSNNFSTTLGSELDLNTGTFKLGGSTSPKLSWNGTTLSLTGDINITSGTGFATPASVTASINTATSSLSSSAASSLTSVSSSAASSITTVSSSLITVSSSFSSSLSVVSSSAASSITSVSSSLNTVSSSFSSSLSIVSSSVNTRITSVSSSLIIVSSSAASSLTSVSSSAAVSITSAVNRIVTDANNKITKTNNTPTAGAGLYLSENYLGHYANSAWNSYISSSGEFLFKKDDNNQISFGNNAFTLKVSDSATISGSNINLITPKFFLGGTSQFISGSNGKIEISSSNFHLDSNGNVNMSGDINANTGIFKDVNIIGTIATSNSQTKYLLEPWITGSAELDALSGNDLARLSNIGVGGTSTSAYVFTIGRFTWNANIYQIGSTGNVNIAAENAVTWFSTVTGSNFNTYQDIDTAITFDYSAIGNSSLYSTSGTPLTFDNWGHIVGYSSGEYGKNAQGNFLTASCDSIIFNVPYINGDIIRSSIITDTITIDNVNFTSSANPDSLVLQMQSKFINNIPNWIYATNTSTGLPGPKMYDCKFIIEILNSNSVVLLTDTRIQNSESEWIDFNIPLTAVLLKTKSLISSNYYSNRLKIRLSWQVIKHKLPLNHTAGTAPPQVRMTEMRIVSMPTSIGLSTSTIKFADSYLSSMNSGTAVHGNLIPVDDALYDLGSANQNPESPDHTNLSSTLLATSVPEKRWNNIYGKFLSADGGISVGNSIILQPSSSIATGQESITSGVNSHAEGIQTRTGKFRKVYNTNDAANLMTIYNTYTNLPDNVFSGINFSTNCYVAIGSYVNDVTLNISNIRTLLSEGTSKKTVVLDANLQCSASFVITVACSGGSLSGTYFGPADPLEYISFTFYALRYQNGAIFSTYNKYINEFSQVNSTNANGAHSEGSFTVAAAYASHAEGDSTLAEGSSSHAEGYLTTATGKWSHAEGYRTQAQGQYSHAEGRDTIALGNGTHAEGYFTQASGDYSHAEGRGTIASASWSHAEGSYTITSASYSHAEGINTETIGTYSHAEGQDTQTGTKLAYSASISGRTVTIRSSYGNRTSSFYENGDLYIYTPSPLSRKVLTISRSFFNSTNTIVELYNTTNTTSRAFVGDITTLITVTDPVYDWKGDQIIPGLHSHTEGSDTIALGISSHAEGDSTIAAGDFSHAEGERTDAIGEGSHAEGWNTRALGTGAHAEGASTDSVGLYSHAEGNRTLASGSYSHAEGQDTYALGSYSHAEGRGSIALGDSSHAEGLGTASGDWSHAEGDGTLAIGNYSHAEGQDTYASASWSHAEGYFTQASGDYSHAEGYFTQASGDYSHAEGRFTTAIYPGSHAEGYYTSASANYQHVQGQYNLPSDQRSAFIHGNGNSDAFRRNLIYAYGTGSNGVVEIGGDLVVTVGNVLCLTPRTSRPTQATTLTGSIMMSGSAGANLGLYVYTGVSTGYGWQRVTLT